MDTRFVLSVAILGAILGITNAYAVSDPTLTPTDQSFYPSIDLTFHVASNETVTYTLDGSDPLTSTTAISGIADGTVLTLTNSTTVEFFETDGTNSSGTFSQTYTLNNNTASPVPEFHPSETPTPSLTHPSFGGVRDEQFNDGLTINDKTFDISHYNTKIPQQQLPLNSSTVITVKQQYQRSVNTWKHVILFMNFKGDTNTGNSDTFISIDKNDGVQVTDPHKFITGVKVDNTNLNGYMMTTSFRFIPVKQMSDSNLIIRAWDNEGRSTDVVVNGAILLGDKPVVKAVILPAGVEKFTDYNILSNALNGFIKPQILSHIKGSISTDTQTYWLLDTNSNKLTLVISDKDGNILFSHTEQLKGNQKPIPSSGLSSAQVQHLLDMGMWEGKIPDGVKVNLSSH